jgi:hypothetical protein
VAAGPEARRDILTRLLNRVWTGPGTFAQDPEGQALLDLTSHTIEEGDEVDYLYGPSGTMWVRYGSEAPHVFRSPALSRAMLALDFQFDPDNRKSLDSLREALKALRHPPPRRP